MYNVKIVRESRNVRYNISPFHIYNKKSKFHALWNMGYIISRLKAVGECNIQIKEKKFFQFLLNSLNIFD